MVSDTCVATVRRPKDRYLVVFPFICKEVCYKYQALAVLSPD